MGHAGAAATDDDILVGCLESSTRSAPSSFATRRWPRVPSPSSMTEELTVPAPDGRNSIAVICWHVSGNLRSRFTDFLTTDGEKAWRHRDEEFEPRKVTRAELLEKWEDGWTILLGTLEDSHG